MLLRRRRMIRRAAAVRQARRLRRWREPQRVVERRSAGLRRIQGKGIAIEGWPHLADRQVGMTTQQVVQEIAGTCARTVQR
ncbi:MAG: hypothetical protein AAFR04_16390, partial [Pseudomonadota bacterium]